MYTVQQYSTSNCAPNGRLAADAVLAAGIWLHLLLRAAYSSF